MREGLEPWAVKAATPEPSPPGREFGNLGNVAKYIYESKP
jgi:hypothetical protein